MEGGKIGGYKAELSPRDELDRERAISYEKGWSEGERHARPENIELAEYILSTIQLAELKDVFLGYLDKSGVPDENANTAAIEQIFTRPEKFAAAYQPLTNQLIFSTSSDLFMLAKQSFAERHELSKQQLMVMQLMFIHEMCHAFSRIRIISHEHGEAYLKHLETGYQIIDIKTAAATVEGKVESTVTKTFEALNEGITQRIAEEVFLEYGRRMGDANAFEEMLRTSNVHNSDSKDLWRYLVYENQVDYICERIAKYVGVPKTLVWQGFKRGYFEKPDMFERDVIEFFRETFGESIFEDLSALSNSTSMSELGAFDRKYDVTHPTEYAAKWLNFLGIAKPEESSV